MFLLRHCESRKAAFSWLGTAGENYRAAERSLSEELNLWPLTSEGVWCGTGFQSSYMLPSLRRKIRTQIPHVPWKCPIEEVVVMKCEISSLFTDSTQRQVITGQSFVSLKQTRHRKERRKKRMSNNSKLHKSRNIIFQLTQRMAFCNIFI